VVDINLLPWRASLRLYQGRQIKRTFLIFVFVATTLFLGLRAFMLHKERQVQVSITKWEAKLASYERRKARPSHTNTLSTSALLALRQHQVATQKLFAAMTQLKDTEMCFINMTRTNNKVSFSGYTRSTQGLTTLLTSWPAAPLFSEVKLEQLESQQQPFLRFRFQAVESLS
jgi:Tfp pilus assembly protein PilN